MQSKMQILEKTDQNAVSNTYSFRECVKKTSIFLIPAFCRLILIYLMLKQNPYTHKM